MKPVVGQRWMNYSEPEMGLGVIHEVLGRRVEINFPAIDEIRVYAIENAPLSRIQYVEGDQLSDQEDVVYKVKSIEELQGLLTYLCEDGQGREKQIPEQSLSHFVRLSTPQQRLKTGLFDDDSAYYLRFETMFHLHHIQQSPVGGLLGSRIDLIPHQLYIAHQVAQRYAPRVLLADEVGLGKTIEAGMILHHQIFTGQAKRVLILVPETLQHQWLVEMLRRFNLFFALFDEERINAIIQENKTEGESNLSLNPFEMEQQIICSLNTLTEHAEFQSQLLSAEWDLVVVDEAHHLAWSEEAVSDDYALVEKISKVSKGLLLLTATPEQIGIESHFARLRLLDPARFYSLEEFKKEQNDFLRLGDLVKNVQQLDAPDFLEDAPDHFVQELCEQLPKDIDKVHEAIMDPEGRQSIIRQMLDRHGTGRVLFRNTRQTVKGFPERQLHEYPLDPTEVFQENSSDIFPEVNLDEEIWLQGDPRVAWLQEQLRCLHNEKVLVICHYDKTAKALDKYLNRQGILCTSFYRGLSLIQRDRAAAYFADMDNNSAQVLICSEIGSEGRNFQFSHHLILFDLPDNPDLLEQRIGRLDRIGQQSSIQIHVPYLKNTAQSVLFHWYHQGLNAFEKNNHAAHALSLSLNESLQRHLQQPDEEISTLIDDTKQASEVLEKQLEDGRDYLLELNSCNGLAAHYLADLIHQQADTDKLSSYLFALFDEFGMDYEAYSSETMFVRPSNVTAGEYFPGLSEEGQSITLNRGEALCRDDMTFVTWEHPLVTETMAAIQDGSLGRVVVSTVQLKGLKPGTLMLESLFVVNHIAPKMLQLHRYMPMSPIRFLVDVKGKDLSQIMPHAKLNGFCDWLKKPIARQAVAEVRPQIDQMMTTSQQLADEELVLVKNEAIQRVKQGIGSELERLKSLQQINSSVRDEEIHVLEERIATSLEYVDRATYQLDAVRLLIST